MGKQVYISQGPEDNLRIAREILTSCKEQRIFAFYGELGAGKTTLIKQFCRVLGVTTSVTSPTFSLIHEYEGTDTEVYHFDLYRIKSEMEAVDIGVEAYLDSEGIVLIEWPERIPTLLPSEAVRIELSIQVDQSRLISCIC